MVLKEQWQGGHEGAREDRRDDDEEHRRLEHLGFLAGIGLVWLYAAIRPRYGPGAGTAVKAGVAVWFFAHLLWTIGSWNMGLFPTNTTAIGTAWSLVETIVAALVGGWIYKEA